MTPACSIATTTAIGAASSPACATASATCSTSWGRRRRPQARPLRTRAANAVSQRLHHSENRFPVARDRIRHAAFPNFVIYQLHVGTFFTPNLPRKAGHLSRCGAQDSAPRRTRHHRDPAPADPGVSDRNSASATMAPTTSPRRWTLRWRTRTSRRTSPRERAARCQGPDTVRRRGPARRDESAQGADRPLPHLRPRGAPGRGLQPRRRRVRRPEPLLLRPAIDRRRQSELALLHRPEAMPVGWCSTSASPKCAIS